MGKMESMRILGLEQLYSCDFNLQNIVVYYVRTPNGQVSTTLSDQGRVNQGLVFVCKNKYDYKPVVRDTLSICSGEVLYLPKYSRYSHVALCTSASQDAYSIVVNFDMYSSDGEPVMLSRDLFKTVPRNRELFQSLFEALTAAYGMNMHSTSKVKSILYSIFAELCSLYKYNDCNPQMKDFFSIRHALQFIEQNNTVHVSVKELADMCFLSENAFRKAFKAYAGMLPSEYIQKLKMEKAKICLKDHMLSVSQTAQILNFNDIAYFSRAFKKYTGQTPGKYK